MSGRPVNERWTEDLAALTYREAKRRTLIALDNAYFAEVLFRAGGNVSEAARRAGLDAANFKRAHKRAVTRKGNA